MQNAECRMPNGGGERANAECGMPNAECRMEEGRGRMRNAECRRPNGKWGETREHGRWEEVVDLDEVGERLVVRTREAGDRFEPLGLGAPKKLKDFLIDARVPRAERERTLVVAGRSGIVWVVGLRLDERAKVRPGTRRVARLRAGRLEGASSARAGTD